MESCRWAEREEDRHRASFQGSLCRAALTKSEGDLYYQKTIYHGVFIEVQNPYHTMSRVK